MRTLQWKEKQGLSAQDRGQVALHLLPSAQSSRDSFSHFHVHLSTPDFYDGLCKNWDLGGLTGLNKKIR